MIKDILSNNKILESLAFFKDEKFGGYFSAIDYDKNNILTKEKSIEDQSLVLLGLLFANNTASKSNIVKLTQYIKDSIDEKFGGVIEFKESYGLINELGNTKTTYRTFLALYALLLASNYLEDKSLAKLVEKEYFIVQNKVFNNSTKTYLNKLTSDYSHVMDSSEHINAISYSLLLSTLLVENTEVLDKDTVKSIIDRDLQSLIRKINTFKTVVDKTDKYGDLLPNSVVDGESIAITVFALSKVYDLNKDKEILKSIEKVVLFLNEYLWDKKYKGYFTHSNIDGKVTIHKEFVTLLTSAIPVKTSRVNLFALLANKIANKYLNNFNTNYIYKVENYLISLYDKVNGGFFIGEGYFWTPPSTPVGPFHRLMLPSRETPGTFHFGSSSFLRLYNKYVSSQAVALLAFNYQQEDSLILEQKIPKSVYEPISNHQLIDHNFDLKDQEYINVNDYISGEKHIEWIMEGYTPKIGFGWTPNHAPIGTKPDKTPAVFGTHHSISNLKVLGKEIENKAEIANWIRACQRENGAYGEYPGGPSDVLNTYLAIDLLDILGEKDFGNKEKCIEFLQSCQNEDGGFGVVPGFKSDLFHSNLAAVALETLGAKPKELNSLINYYLSARNPDGGFGEYVGAESDTYSCYRTISTFALYNLEIPDKEKTANFIKSCQQTDGGFSNDSSGISSMIATYHCSASLTLLGEKPNDLKGALNWLSKCQTPDGGFSNIPGVTTGTIDEGFAAVQSICLLLNGLNNKWAVFVS
ncbi:prenyltransferase/squalene oxidase repeat-containing protein [Streptococcus infantarius]|uniref:prenyltransferase/squalene oxidase repeat-containing protein n=1 Tax=Streptococcus infantarius TaxID=102684 RepID=UPI003D105CEE